MFQNIINLFQPAPHITAIQDTALIKKHYAYWRLRIFSSMYVGYALYYFTRKNFTFITPFLSSDLGLTKTEIGALASILSLAYGVSKFASGVLCDRSNPRYFMAFGLILTGLCSLLFSFFSSIFLLAFFWGLNGWFQGWGWPACTKQLTHWFSRTERGTWWGFFSTSHTVGGFLIAYVAVYCANLYGWRFAMFLPGVLCIMAGCWLLNRLRDVPQSLGLPSIEVFKNETETSTATGIRTSLSTQSQASPLSVKQILFDQVLSNRYVWVVAFAYFFVYVVRTAVNDWGPLYLAQVKGYTPMAAAACVSLFEVGGFAGVLFAGWGSDYWFQGRRIPLVIMSSVILALTLLGLWHLEADQPILMSGLMAIIGFFVFCPQMLVGLAAAEFVSKQAASTSNGFAGFFACTGASMAGYPLGRMTELWGWYQGFVLPLMICSMICALVLLPLWFEKTGQKHAKVPSQARAEDDPSGAFSTTPSLRA